MIVDLFAGPGGWSEGLRMLSPAMHTTEIGFEWDKAACDTRAAAGHRTIRTDIAAYPTEPFSGVTGLIASPPCQDFSLAGTGAGISGERGKLITQVLRWAEDLRPEWIACEQVPPALSLWKQYAEHLRGLGYSVWAGVLNAADYGVPQTRRRAILIASRVRDVQPPEPTHAQHPAPSLFGNDLEPWVTMADALQCPEGFIGFPRRDEEDPTKYRRRDVRATSEPAHALTGKVKSWMLNPGATGSDRSVLNRRWYSADEAAPTVAFGHDSAGWVWHDGPEQVRITTTDALVLQSFPADYPVSGSKTKQFEQIGNAVPPLLAAHVLSAVAGVPFIVEVSA